MSTAPYDTPLLVATLPLDISAGDRQTNLSAVSAAFGCLPDGIDVAVLPELFSTGYIADKEAMSALADTVGSDGGNHTMSFVRTLARDHNCAVAGSYAARCGDKVYNRAFFAEPDGTCHYYDKRHLFGLGGEADIIAGGDSRCEPISFRGWNISMIICYDLRFPVWCRSLRNSYDVLLVPSAWPQSRGYAFEHLLIARAIENQCYVVGADRGGEDKYGLYDGMARIYDFTGRPIGTYAPSSPWLTAGLSRTLMNRYRTSFPVAADADNFEIMK